MSADEWLKKIWYIHTINVVQPEKEGNSDTCYNMDET